jgi:DNA-binding transcriptional regulator YiaG
MRERLGYTQSEFADRMGVRQGTVSRWETGMLTPRGAALKLLEYVAEPLKVRGKL